MFKRDLVFEYNDLTLSVCGLKVKAYCNDIVDIKFRTEGTVDGKVGFVHEINVELKMIARDGASCKFSVWHGKAQYSLVELPAGKSHTIEVDVKADKVLS